MLLENYSESNTYISFNPTTGSIQKVSGKSGKTIRTNGFYFDFRGIFMCLYIYMGSIVFRYMDKAFELKSGVTLEVEGDIEDRRLLVFVGDIFQEELPYSIDTESIIGNDPTPFIEDEDFDFGLWVSNISKNEPRKKVLYDNYT